MCKQQILLPLKFDRRQQGGEGFADFADGKH
jgi:hypothetical protein